VEKASGELNLTVITIVAIAAVAAFFMLVIWPGLQRSIQNNQCRAECGNPNVQVNAAGDCVC